MRQGVPKESIKNPLRFWARCAQQQHLTPLPVHSINSRALQSSYAVPENVISPSIVVSVYTSLGALAGLIGGTCLKMDEGYGRDRQHINGSLSDLGTRLTAYS